MLRVVLGLAVLAFTIYTLVDCIQTPDDEVRGLPKIVWALLILLFPLAGGGAWFLAGRPHGAPLSGDVRRRGRPQSRPRGPDDDPDFLRNL